MTSTSETASSVDSSTPRRRGSRARRVAEAARAQASARPVSRPNASLGAAGPSRAVLVLGCGALANELKALVKDASDSDSEGRGIDVECLPAKLHNRPAYIAGEVRARLDRLAQQGRTYERILLGYGDCGSAGAIDALCAEFERAHAAGNGPAMTRVPGAHCYEFFAGAADFARLSDDEPATFYLTDYLARHFDLLVWNGLGIADHPELAEMYFGNYRRVVLLTQTCDDAERARVEACARAGAERLGLPLEVVRTGYGELADAVTSVRLDPPARQSAAPAGGSAMAQTAS
ncbi:DUF1638 domain-containing protein [Candidatus Poriferisodalis sp.]|uniref:DUF1638 domain-containing protein n=1 Tax=Candidatus Poriferisodalis sp. TaxID=3101277 RepID=UPI003B521DD8